MKSPKGQFTIQTKRFFQLIVLSFILIVFDISGILFPVKGMVESVISPVKGVVYRRVAAIGNIVDLITNFSRAKSAISTVSKLQRDDDTLRIQVQKLILENESLRKQLDAPLPSSYQFIPAQVLGISRYMQVWGGVKEGVMKGMIAVEGTVYIGKVISSGEHTSTIILANDPDASIPAITSRGTRGKVTGEFGEKIFLNMVLQKDLLFLGDSVTTSGEDGYPPDLLIGKIHAITAQDYQVYKRAELLSPLSYSKITTVFMIKGI